MKTKTHWWNSEDLLRTACGANPLAIDVFTSPMSVTCKTCLNRALASAKKQTAEASKKLFAAQRQERDISRRIRSLSDELTI